MVIDEITKNTLKLFSERCKTFGIDDWLQTYANHQIPDHIDPFTLRYFDNEKFYRNGLLRNNVRLAAIKMASFSLITNEWVDELVKEMVKYSYKKPEDLHVIEVMAGLGALTKALRDRGINCTACDLRKDVLILDYENNSWIDDINIISAQQMLRTYNTPHEVDFIICSWPRIFAGICDVLDIMHEKYPQALLIYIGEGITGCCAEMDFFNKSELVKKPIKLNELYPSWYELSDFIGFYNKKI